MRVLVTRPEPDAQALGEALRALGHEPIIAPLLKIEASDHPLPDDWASRMLLFTSANGVRMGKARGLSGACYVVGAATAATAKEAGLTVAGVAEGDVAALVALVIRSLPKGARLLHVSGADTAGDLAGTLAAQGFDVGRFMAYLALATERLPQEASQFLAGPPGAALIFSPRTAAILSRLIAQAGLEPETRKHRAIALSSTVAKEAANLPWRAIEVAERPEQEALLRLL